MVKQVHLFFICLQFFSSFSDAFNNMVSNRSLQLQQSNTLLNRSRSGSIMPRPDTVMTLHSNPNDEMDGARHTYVEGGEYDDIFSEIEAMGGGKQNCLDNLYSWRVHRNFTYQQR